MLTILSIDDDPQSLSLREDVLRAEGFQVLNASSGPEGIALANEHTIDLVVLDYSMPEMDGEQVAKILRQTHPDVPIVLYSGMTEIPERVFALVNGFVMKPGGCLFLIATIRSLLSHKKPSSGERDLSRTG